MGADVSKKEWPTGSIRTRTLIKGFSLEKRSLTISGECDQSLAKPDSSRGEDEQKKTASRRDKSPREASNRSRKRERSKSLSKGDCIECEGKGITLSKGGRSKYCKVCMGTGLKASVHLGEAVKKDRSTHDRIWRKTKHSRPGGFNPRADPPRCFSDVHYDDSKLVAHSKLSNSDDEGKLKLSTPGFDGAIAVAPPLFRQLSKSTGVLPTRSESIGRITPRDDCKVQCSPTEDDEYW
jgi:hypothetical protein